MRCVGFTVVGPTKTHAGRVKVPSNLALFFFHGRIHVLVSM